MSNGWIQEPGELLANCIVFKHASFGWVTIDLKLRVFSPGIGQPRSYRPGPGYTGKGWKERLIRDAQTHVAGLWSAA